MLLSCAGQVSRDGESLLPRSRQTRPRTLKGPWAAVRPGAQLPPSLSERHPVVGEDPLRGQMRPTWRESELGWPGQRHAALDRSVLGCVGV